ncbi:tetratricopeptide repeat-containing sulfotransferase family protein [Phenylobacterium sp.]|jgi:tetratricopeptide (TPR) repeat protein|uniref:tetratricopeptide repeat-containing sulfotransferase family protein n=1 Tax=Phenylobacterium sp. TaxID=1871053 RepID=UPI002E312BB2|nr:sulfotransferase [Phenylobacterium sp.]HEX3367658.1 sulfotransferase [Phenylobacterium sp.]
MADNSPAAIIARAAALLASDPGQARREAEAILRLAPSDPRALLILASARRRLGDAPGAHAVLAPLAQAYPRAATTQYELGLTLADLGEAAPAAAALHNAVSLNRDLADAWRALGDLKFKAGEVAAAEAAFAEHRRATVTDPALKGAAEALFAGRVAEAETQLRAHLTRHLADAAATRMLAEVYLRQSRYGDAEILFARALELDPGHDGARFGYADALFRQQKASEALVEVERLLALAPKDPAYLNLQAACLALVGEDARVIAIYEGLLADYPRQPRLWLNYGHTLRAVGRREEAVTAYKKSLELAPGLGDAYWSLANLKVAALGPADEAAMLAGLDRGDLTADDRLHLHYALGKALEDRGEPAAAFEHYARGAALRRTETPYDAAETTAQLRRAEALFTREVFAERAGAGSPSEAPIFIVGLPRAGSTLVEQILASHSQVEGTMELPDLGLIARGFGPSYPEALASLDAAALTALGERYLATTRVHRKLGRAFFIDKMPNNFQHVGLIQLFLPRAKIIDARRHPLGSGFSAFKQHFAQGQAFSYDLADVGAYYRDYVAWMDHIDAVLPGRVHRVIYEDLVQDTEAEVARLLAYCGLPFEDACLRFHENSRAVRTVSSEQVRRPIFRDGLEQWRAYEPWLDPLKAALGPALAGWRGRG